MATYTTQQSNDPQITLNEVLAHLPSFDVNLISVQNNTDSFIITLDKNLTQEQIDHLLLQEVV